MIALCRKNTGRSVKCLFGVVVKTPARESADPGLEIRLTVHRKSRRLLNAFVIEYDKVGERPLSNTGV